MGLFPSFSRTGIPESNWALLISNWMLQHWCYLLCQPQFCLPEDRMFWLCSGRCHQGHCSRQKLHQSLLQKSVSLHGAWQVQNGTEGLWNGKTICHLLIPLLSDGNYIYCRINFFYKEAIMEKISYEHLKIWWEKGFRQ